MVKEIEKEKVDVSQIPNFCSNIIGPNTSILMPLYTWAFPFKLFPIYQEI